MRLWSIHPKYLDNIGLVALWREGLLAKAVLEGKTKGYTNHPQLERFKNQKAPIKTINAYLAEVWIEASNRSYAFDKNKINFSECNEVIKVNSGQIEYEYLHLLKKLKTRNISQYMKIKKENKIKAHPLIKIKIGPIEEWEILNKKVKSKKNQGLKNKATLKS